MDTDHKISTVYAIVPSWGGYQAVETRIGEVVGERVRVEWGGNPIIDRDMIFESYLDCLRKLLQLHDESCEKERKRILERIRRAMKKEKVSKWRKDTR